MSLPPPADYLTNALLCRRCRYPLGVVSPPSTLVPLLPERIRRGVKRSEALNGAGNRAEAHRP